MSLMQVVQHEARTTEWWYEQFKAERLDLEPDFQRRSNLWSRYKQAHLIDSILNGYDLPKFYVADFTLGRSSLNVTRKPYAVVDGKQRFGALFAFLSNQLALNKSSTYEAEPSVLIRGLTFEQLKKEHPTLAAKVLSFRPVVMSIVTDDRAKIAEMFVRLNSGEAANSAEKRNAQPGPIPALVRELVDHAFFRDRVSFNKKRMADHQVAAKLLFMEYRGGPVDTKAQDIDRFVQRAAEETVPPQFEEPTRANQAALERYERTSDDVIVVLERMAEAFRSNDPLLSASGRIPIYYLVLRNHPEATENFRDFVHDFESKVIDAMRAARDRNETPNQAYLNYYTLSRTSNDQKSVRERYQMIVSELRRKHLID
jgi:hypothetical protein